MVDGGGFVAGVDHAVGALGVAGFGAVFVPGRGFHEFLERIGVAVLQEVAGFLPAEDVEVGHAQVGAFVLAFAHQEFKEQRALVELPVLFAVGEDFGEELAGFGAAEEVGLVGGFVVGVAGGDHHAFDAEVHHFIEEGADTGGVGAVEEGGVGGDAEAAFDGFLDAVDSHIISAIAADGEIVVVFLAVHVDTKKSDICWV